MREGDEGIRETQCLRSNAKGDRVAPGAPSRESEGRKGHMGQRNIPYSSQAALL